MRKHRFLHQAVSVMCAVAILIGCLQTTAYAETPEERYRRLQGELADISEQLNDYKNDKAQTEKYKKALQQQQAVLQEMIELNRQQIEQTQAQLDAKADEVTLKRAELYENEELFRRRLVAIYKQNDAGMLSTALNVDDMSELLAALDAMQRIAKNDTELIQHLNEQRIALEAEQAEIDAMLADLNAQHEELAANAETLAQNISAQDARISAAEAQIQAQQEAYDDTYAALVAAQKEMAAIAGKLGGSTSNDGSEYVGGQLAWPVNGFYGITCYYGAPDPNGTPHRGMDISGSGVNGATISAAGNGTVIVASYAHSSYGNYIVIDHGGGIKTLYAHCSALWVGVGTPVVTGTAIGAVGATGFVTGPHLHFEVLLNNATQNPLAYLKA